MSRKETEKITTEQLTVHITVPIFQLYLRRINHRAELVLEELYLTVANSSQSQRVVTGQDPCDFARPSVPGFRVLAGSAASRFLL